MLPVLLAACLSAPNVILISVDTLRADHLGLYGYPHPTSPHLDQLADRSLVFDDMVCEIPLTGPSFCAMMTSQFPRTIGVTRNGLRLGDEPPTAAEMFRAAGYETLCVTSNWTLKRELSGLDRGFDVYEDGFKKKRWGIIKSERDAEEVTSLALELLERRDAARPLFAWFHYSDPHAPYHLHRAFKVSDRSDWPEDGAARVKVKYDSEIAYTDFWVSKVLEAIPKENTYVVFLSDHGESLGEHDYLGHGRRIYQAGLRIPFMVAGPGIRPGRSGAKARGVDVATTLLGLAGLDVPPVMQGIDLLNGSVPAARARVVETYGGAVLNVPGAKEIMAGRGPKLQGVLQGSWKLVLDGKRKELYHLAKDPGELVNLADRHPDRVDALTALVVEWSDRVARGNSETDDLSDEDVEALRSLGYIE